MRLIRRALGVAAAIPLAGRANGCAATELGAEWIGRDVRGAISRFGPPTRASTVDGGDTVYAWERLRH